MTRDQEELSAELAESSAEGKALSQLESASESRCTQLERQLDSLTQQLSTSQAKSADLLDQLRTVNQGIISSRTRCAELKAELAEEHAARSRLESELDLLSQQPARNGAGAELPSASSARKAETAQEELQKLRWASCIIWVLALCMVF